KSPPLTPAPRGAPGVVPGPGAPAAPAVEPPGPPRRARGDPAAVVGGRFDPPNAGQAVTVRADPKRGAHRRTSNASRLHSAGAGALCAHASHAACGRTSAAGAERNPGSTW